MEREFGDFRFSSGSRQQLSGRLAVFQSLGQSASRFLFRRALSWPTSLDIPLMAFQPPRKMPVAETRTSVAGRRRKRRVTNWLHAADWRCEANRSSKVSDARDQRGSIAKIALQTISMFYGFQRKAYLHAFGDVRPS